MFQILASLGCSRDCRRILCNSQAPLQSDRNFAVEMVLLPVLQAAQAGNMLTSLSASHHRRLVACHGLRRGADGEEGVLRVTEIHLDRTGLTA